ncbi:helix-turn-helix domain-containing protein [Paenibacillus harenae]|uniref:AraC-like DNA-binding protein n=1 Tax=Paenibacillus harenae TaxID=306543 RepID=A0ABT9TZ67_PAEHA|nr:AraC family transcriptional regulator [Paenibacillus harenae]MDQ0112608.1 AraC-like DNA-binding protein [Paenibacillus harenae]
MSDVTFYRHEALPFLEAKRCLKSDLAYQKHFHEEYSIGLIDKGVTNAWCDGTMHRVEDGKAISFPPVMLHACQPETGMEWNYKMLFVKQAWLEQLELELHEREQLQIPFLLAEDKNKVCRIQINQIMDALREKGSPLEIETALIELMHALVSRNASDLVHEIKQGKQEQKYVKLIQDYMHEHFTEKLTMKELENVTGISRFHLIRLFKRWNHLPPHAYQNLLRINYAKAELMKQRPIADIATDAGFYDQSHFARTFGRIVGATPYSYTLSC